MGLYLLTCLVQGPEYSLPEPLLTAVLAENNLKR